MPWKADTEAYLCYYSSCPTLIDKSILYFYFYMRAQ